ncbi:MAG TPA: prolyl oligopeptidase family serine peptidase, partial [Armatimonadota bacterium]|nr:prolyl oligopeptidase family serine peptidase [Armatimonadota bacterium]
AMSALGLATCVVGRGDRVPYRPEIWLQEQVVGDCREALEAGASARRLVPERDWQEWRARVLGVVREPFPAVLFARGRDLKARVVSRHEFDTYRIENVLFESLPGWEVNGSVYLPREPGVYPGVVCPTGHSSKTGPSYQQPAQVFARNGYVAISFDPPGCAGELGPGNDHFTHGFLGYLTGFWSQTHFVADAIACMDYLSTRPDVDAGLGFAVTGVSGGGLTSIFTAMLDERVRFVAPVCCVSTHETLHLDGLYTSCPEQFGPGYISGMVDFADYLGALVPKPLLIVSGRGDEVFKHEAVLQVADDVEAIYEAADAKGDFGLFVDQESGHAYTVAMANEVVRWMNRALKGIDADALPLTADEVPLTDPANLMCHPSTAVNMATINRAEAERLLALRQRAPRDGRLGRMRAAARRLLAVDPDARPHAVIRLSDPQTSWHALVGEIGIRPLRGTDGYVPGVLFTHVEDRSPRPGLLWIDDQGKWAAFRHDGFLARPLRMFEASCSPEQPRILSIDVAGLGSLSPEPTAYDLAGWNDIERNLTYLSIANARPIMGLRVRDALCAFAELRDRPDVDPDRLMVGGRGIGAVVALHVALLRPEVKRLICLEGLSDYGSYTRNGAFAWRESLMIPGVLKHYDLPEVVAALRGCECILANLLDSMRSPVPQAEAAALYAEAIAGGATVVCGADGGAAVAEAVSAAW